MSNSFIDQSKLNWVPAEDKANLDQLQIGCLQRIASSSELMAKNHLKLQADHDMYKRWYENERTQKEKLLKRLSGYKGVVTKMKNKRTIAVK